jgi:SAM-dependent methyltransferase
LDVGCGDGRYLRALTKRGLPRAQAFGLELDQRAVDRLTGEGFPVYCERVEDCERIPDGSLDLITMFHVIEHVTDPAATLDKLARWLAPGGVLAIETPNLESIDAHWFRDGTWGGYHIPRHFHIFTPGSLEKLVSDAGLELLDVRYQTGHSFWMYSLHHLLRYRERPWPKLARLFNPLGGSLGLLALFTGLDKLRAAFGYKTSAMLCLARKP